MCGRSVMDERGRFRACLLGGAMGDALGGAVEFMSLEATRGQFGPGGSTPLKNSTRNAPRA